MKKLFSFIMTFMLIILTSCGAKNEGKTIEYTNYGGEWTAVLWYEVPPEWDVFDDTNQSLFIVDDKKNVYVTYYGQTTDLSDEMEAVESRIASDSDLELISSTDEIIKYYSSNDSNFGYIYWKSLGDAGVVNIQAPGFGKDDSAIKYVDSLVSSLKAVRWSKAQ